MPADMLRPENRPVVEVKDLQVSYSKSGRRFSMRLDRDAFGGPSVDQDYAGDTLKGVDLVVWPGGILAVLGASGSGKTTLGKAVLGTLPANTRSRAQWICRPVRPAFVQQEATASLHPLLRADVQVRDVLMARGFSRPQARERAASLLQEMGLSGEAGRGFAHTLSGGQAQRVALARAVAVEPDLLVADEPTSALDITKQADIMRLMFSWVRSSGTALLLITHDIALAAEMADRVMVLHDGACVEEGSVTEVLKSPRHEVTRKLLESGDELHAEA